MTQALEDRIRVLEAELAQARETNRSLNRRVQKAEGGYLSEIERHRNRAEYYAQQLFRAHDRTVRLFDTFKQVYEACAPAAGLRTGRYHSVMDYAQTDPVYVFKMLEAEPGRVYANVLRPAPACGIDSYDILDVVREAVRALQERAGGGRSEAHVEAAPGG